MPDFLLCEILHYQISSKSKSKTITLVTQRQPVTRQRTTNTTEIDKQSQGVIPLWKQLATDQSDPWQVVPRQVFIPNSCLLISNAFVVVSRVGCLGVTGVIIQCQTSSNHCES